MSQAWLTFREAACVLAAFRAMTFPQPEGGVVEVTYPLRFVADTTR